MPCYHAQVVLTVAIESIVEAFVHEFRFIQFFDIKGTYIHMYITMLTYVHKSSYNYVLCTYIQYVHMHILTYVCEYSGTYMVSYVCIIKINSRD